ncbi:MAG TPA: hypothetical protein PKW79_05580 [Rhabdochlamydiaceae bacterium]|nr:hypothetical protein [Rhabdochlamydiaceae bacterium]
MSLVTKTFYDNRHIPHSQTVYDPAAIHWRSPILTTEQQNREAEGQREI